MANNIPAGYQLHIRSWENDGDNYQTIVTNGLTKDECECMIAIAELFGSRSRYGNDYLSGEGQKIIVEAIRHIFETIPVVRSEQFEEMFHLDAESFDPTYDALVEHILGSGVDNDGMFFCRAVDYYKVFFVPSEITNVTSQFIKQ